MDYNDISELVLKAQHQDIYAMEYLYRVTRDNIYQLIYSMCQDQHEAEDILQETFILIFSNIHTVPDPQYFIPWAKKIATNYTLRYMQKGRDIPVDDISDLIETLSKGWTSDPLDDLVSQEKYSHIDSLIASLSPGLRQAVELKYYGEYKMCEIAEILDVPVGTVKSRLHKAKVHLKKKIMEDKHFFSLFAPFIPMSMVLPNEISNALSPSLSKSSLISDNRTSATKTLTSSTKSNHLYFFKAGLATGSVAVSSALIISAFDTPPYSEPINTQGDNVLVQGDSTTDIPLADRDVIAPEVLHITTSNDYIIVTVADDSNINFSQAHGITADGNSIKASHYDTINGLIFYPKVFEAFTLSISDVHGNTSNTRIELSQSIQ